MLNRDIRLLALKIRDIGNILTFSSRLKRKTVLILKFLLNFLVFQMVEKTQAIIEIKEEYATLSVPLKMD